LADRTLIALPGWVERCVLQTWGRADFTGDPLLADATHEAGRWAGEDIGSALQLLLAADVDEQRTTPLAVLRSAVVYPTGVLEAAGVKPVARDRFTVQRFPEDPYGLTPSSFADIDPELAPVALAWGAAKAVAHRRRHGSREAGR
jgi:hypothetical protein